MRGAAAHAWQRGLAGRLVTVLFAVLAIAETPALVEQAVLPVLVPVGTAALIAVVAIRRSAPRLALTLWFPAAIGQAAAVGLTTETEAAAGFIAALLVVLAAGRHLPAGRARRRTALVVVLLALVDIVLIGLTAPLVLGDFIFPFVFTVGPFALGVLAADRAAAAAELHEVAALAQEEAGADDRRAAQGERRRIALEMHDVVGHSISVMVLQAAAARRTAATRPDDAAAAIEVLRAAGAAARAELDVLLGVLPEGLPHRAPGLTLDAAALLARFRAADLAVHVEGSLPPLPVDPAVDLAAYRVLQEALTNCARHAPGAAVVVRGAPTMGGTDGWTLEIEGREMPGTARHRRAPTLASGGHGIIGMRERMSALGGALDAGPQADAFLVRARFPPAEPAQPGSSPGTTTPCS